MSKAKKRTRLSAKAMANIDNNVLSFIAEHRNVNSTRLEKHTKASPATIARVIKRQVEAGKLERVKKGNRMTYQLVDKSAVKQPVRQFPTIQLADKTRTVHFAVLDANGVQVIDVKGEASDSRILSIMSELAGVK